MTGVPTSPPAPAPLTSSPPASTTGRRGRDGATSVAAVFALLPGFAFPFVASWSIGPTASDRLLLAVSVAITLIGVVGSAIEANTVSEVGRASAAGAAPGRAALRPYERRVLRFAGLVTLLVGGGLIALYSVGVGERRSFVLLAALVLVVPLLGALASVRSGELIAHGVVTPTILLQSSRMLVPLVVVLAWRGAPLAAVAAGYVLGEAVRLTALSAAVRRRRRHEDVTGQPDLPTRGLIWQAASSLTAQGGPVTDRVFLAGAPTGSLSSYEMADKLFFAATQFLNLGFLVRRLAGWSRLPFVPVAEGRALLRRDLRALALVSGAVALLVLGGALTATTLTFLPATWRQAFGWAAILSLSVPMVVAGLCGGRLLIIARRQQLLIRLSAVSVTANALLDWLFFELLGAVGIPLATVAVRTVSALLYLVVVRRALAGFVGSELEAPTAREPESSWR